VTFTFLRLLGYAAETQLRLHTTVNLGPPRVLKRLLPLPPLRNPETRLMSCRGAFAGIADA
jgi:hypothetical protein